MLEELSRELLLDLYINQRMKLKEVSEFTGWSKTQVIRKINEYNLQKRNHRYNTVQIQQLHNEGKSVREISQLTDISEPTILKRLKTLCLYDPNHIPATQNLVGKTFGDLRVLSFIGTQKRQKSSIRLWRCECSCGTFVDLDTANVKRYKSCGQKRCVNRNISLSKTLYNNVESFFSTIRHDSAYLLGLLTADGCVCDSKETAKRISITSIDFDMIEYVRNCLSPSRPINTYKIKNYDKNYYSICLTSNKMADDLAKYYIIPRKTGQENVPILEQDFFGDYLRGLFDGDGNINIFRRKLKNNSISINASVGVTSASRVFLEKIKSQSGSIGYIYKDKRGEWYDWKITSRKDIMAFFDIIYKHKDSSFYLKRKYDKFLELFN